MSDETSAAYGEVVWSWRRDPGVNPAGLCRRGNGDNKGRSPGRARSKPSNHRAGKAGIVSAELVVTTLVCFSLSAREAAGAVSARLSLRPLLDKRDNEFAKLGRKRAAGMKTCVSTRAKIQCTLRHIFAASVNREPDHRKAWVNGSIR